MSLNALATLNRCEMLMGLCDSSCHRVAMGMFVTFHSTDMAMVLFANSRSPDDFESVGFMSCARVMNFFTLVNVRHCRTDLILATGISLREIASRVVRKQTSD